MRRIFSLPPSGLACLAGFVLSGCNLAQNEFDTSLAGSAAPATPIASIAEGGDAFAASAAEAAALGLPFPRIAQRADNLSATAPAQASVQAQVPSEGSVDGGISGAGAAFLSGPPQETASETRSSADSAVVADAGKPSAADPVSAQADASAQNKVPSVDEKASESANTTTAFAAAPETGVEDEIDPEPPRKEPFPSIDEIIAAAKKSGFATSAGGGTLQSYGAFSVAGKHVDTSCFPRKLKTILARIEKEYGVKPSVNSGYRNVSYNRRVGGVEGSYHITCEAADIYVAGVGKRELAEFLRAIPDIGGVGTYGCKSIVHVDVGRRRDWDFPCRTRRNEA